MKLVMNFCLIGIFINDIEKLGLDIDKIDEEYGDFSEYLYYLLNNTDISYHGDDGCYWIGIDHRSMKDDETLKEFKNRAFSEIKKKFPNIDKDIEIEWQANYIVSI